MKKGLYRLGLGIILLFLAGSRVLTASGISQADATINFTCCSYSPPAVAIVAGQSVEWVGDFASHPLVSDEGLWSVHNSGASFTFSFNNPGPYRFYCAVHGGPNGFGMSGRVIVLGNENLYLPVLVR